MFLGVGAVCLLIGLVALCVGQPFYIWFYLVLLGGLISGLCGMMVFALIPNAYRRAEANRLAAEELRSMS